MLSMGVQLLSNSSSSSTVVTNSTVDGAVNNVSTIAELISKYGMTIVIVAVFILILMIYSFFMIRMVTNLNKRINDSNSDNQEMTKNLMNKILDDYLSNKGETKPAVKEIEKEEKEEKNLVSGYTYATMSMNDASRIVMADIKCDRVGVYVFHNGNQTPFGFPFVKLTCINEFSMKGGCTTLRGLSHNGLPLHVVSDFVDSLTKNGEVVIGNIFNHSIIYSDDQIANFISGAIVNSLFALPIYADNGEIAAFTIAEFRDETDFSELEIYSKVRDALDLMNKSIRSIVANEDFKREAIMHRGSP